MDLEQAIETQRLRLLRIVAGLVVLIGCLSVGPVSRGFSVWTCRFVGSILSRAEAAARYLVIAQARSMAVRAGTGLRSEQISACLARVVMDDVEVSASECRQRLKALRAVLTNLPRAALRLLRWIEKQARRAVRSDRVSHNFEGRLSISLHDLQLAGTRIERPPDLSPNFPSLFLTSPGTRREAQSVAQRSGLAAR